MSDLAVSLTKSVVVGAVSKALAAIEEEANLRQTVKKDMEFIAAEFEMMQSFLSVADEEGVRNKVMTTLVSQVRDLAYDLEDTIEYVIDLDETPDWHCRCLPGFIRPDLPLDKAVDEIKLFKDRVQEVGHRNMRYNLISDSGSKPVTQQQLVPGASVGATTFDMLIKVDKAVDEIKLFKDRVQEVGHRNMRYNLISDSGSKPVTQQQLVPGASVGATTFDMLIKARDTTKMQRGLGDLTKLLITKKPGGDLEVISVWAAGGNADTTPIIREAYGEPEVCESFGRRGWAKLTHPFNPHEFQRSLLIQFHTNSCLQKEQGVDVGTLKRLGVAAEGELIEEFMEQMKERYLIILENVSSMVEWDTLRAYLPQEKNHSWVIISTQQSEVARLCIGDPWQVFELKQSSGEHSVCVFFSVGSQGRGDKSKQTTMVIGRGDKSKQTTMVMAINNEASSSMGVQNNTGRSPLVKLRESQMKDLLGYLAKACVNGVPVISVWGIAGVGKSDLVRNLYYDIMYDSSKRIFTMYSWVDVSHPFNLWTLAWSLLSQLQSDSPQQSGIGNPLQECHRLLEEHRCLVIIDGLQSTEEWDLIRHYLVSTASRSIIVVITTEASIAIHCANREEAMYNVKSLEDDEARDLFKKVGKFPDSSALRDCEDPKLRKLISMCGGLPKVIVAVANHLAPMTVSWMNSSEKTNHWMRMVVNLSDRFIHDLETKPEFENLRGLFSWMHYYLRTCPDFLRQCIFYLSTFPQGQNIRRRRLVKRWIAEGYSRDMHNRSAEEVGEQFISMLLDLNIIQQPPHSVTTADTRMVFCQVNGFFHEYIASRKDDGVIFELEGRCNLTTQRTGSNLTTQRTRWHLVIRESWERDKKVFNDINFSGLRSLTVFGEWKSFLVCAAMEVLRVLDLENATGVTDKDLKHILKLVRRLKYLSLRGCTEICHLPSSLGDLRQLQTLDVRGTSIVHIPKFITKLKKLQYIRAGRYGLPGPHRYGSVGIDVSRGMDKLTALHTLGVVNVGLSGGKAILKEVKKLTQLHKLGVTGVSKKNSKEFCSAISDHGHLESLSIWLCIGDNEPCLNDTFSPQKKPPQNLQSLKLYGLAKEVPAWIGDLPKLTKLHVNMAISKNINISEVLGEIKGLCILRLDIEPLEDGDGDLNFCVKVNGVEMRCYLNVKILEIACNSELNVSFGSLAMENLELLTARCGTRSAVKFAGLKNLSWRKLKEVRYLGSLDNRLKVEMENQLEQHPKTPALKLEEQCSC